MSTHSHVVSSPPGPPEGPIRGVVATGPVFAAVLERLNRDATGALLEQLSRELDAHCRSLVAAEVRAASAAQALQERPGAPLRRWSVLLVVLAGLFFVLGYASARLGAEDARPAASTSR